uniref:Uncharacterized protein n=1 Tax=Rhizophora mucronata TaxID=61149 RepID=A0A2P2P7R1_RHIMU
MHWTELSV